MLTLVKALLVVDEIDQMCTYFISILRQILKMEKDFAEYSAHSDRQFLLDLVNIYYHVEERETQAFLKWLPRGI